MSYLDHEKTRAVATAIVTCPKPQEYLTLEGAIQRSSALKEFLECIADTSKTWAADQDHHFVTLLSSLRFMVDDSLREMLNLRAPKVDGTREGPS